MSGGGRRGVFLDRDGTLIEDVGYPREPDRVRVLDGVADALRRLAAAGFALVVVSNQSGVGRGLVTPDEARAVHERFLAEMRGQGIELDGAKYCPHAPDDGCDCRKPAPGMLLEAADELMLDLERSYMVGDKPSDAEAARRAGCHAVLLAGPGVGPGDAEYVATGLGDAADFILRSGGRP